MVIATIRRRFVLTKKLLLAVVTLLLAACSISMAQTLTTLKNRPPDGAGVPFLLTDGTVLVQGNQGNDWWKLTPDINGSYVNGTWTQVASLAAGYEPYAMASATLADGRVLIEGGEYNYGQFSFTNLGAIYDPAHNTWTPLTPPAGWDYIGDSPSAILPNGHFLIGREVRHADGGVGPGHDAVDSHGIQRQGRLERRGGLDTDARRHHPDGGCADQSQLRTLRPDAAAMGLRRQHDRQLCRGHRKWAASPMAAANIVLPAKSVLPFCVLMAPCSQPALFISALRPDIPRSIIWDQPDRSWHLGARARLPQWRRRRRQLRCAAASTVRCWWKADRSRLYEFDGTNFTPTLYSNGGSLIVLPTGEVLVGGAEVYKPTGSYLQPWAPTILSYPMPRRAAKPILSPASYSMAGRRRLRSETNSKPPPTTRWCESRTTPPGTSSTPRPTTTATWACRPAIYRRTLISTCLQVWKRDRVRWWW